MFCRFFLIKHVVFIFKTQNSNTRFIQHTNLFSGKHFGGSLLLIFRYFHSYGTLKTVQANRKFLRS